MGKIIKSLAIGTVFGVAMGMMILPKKTEKYDRKNCYYENQLRIKRRYLLAL